MTHIRNRFDIKNAIEDEAVSKKRLPNFFDDLDEISPLKGFSLSILAHLLFIFLAFTLQVFVFSHIPKPTLPSRDVEFKLVEAPSKPPINKNTKIRSDRDSRAGGIHDPKRLISEPGGKPAQKQKQAQKQKPAAPKKEVKQVQQKPAQKPQKTVQNVQKPMQQPVKQPQKQLPPAPQVKKPSPVSAPVSSKPSVKPAVKPSAVPSAPKIATAPKSPFTVPVPPSKAPVGTTYRPQGSQGGSSGGSSSGGSKSGAPAPKFSSAGSAGSAGSRGSSGSSGSSGGSGGYSSRGVGGGYGTGSNPGPGNPGGTPGIDALRQPNWGPYMRDLEQRIKRNWFPPKGDSSKRVVITFTIAKDGRLLSKKITQSSNVPLVDKAAMDAIESTAPFRPLPPECRQPSVAVQFTFDYNVLNSVLR